MYICIYTCVHIHIYICIYTHVCIPCTVEVVNGTIQGRHLCIHIYMCVCVCVCVCVYIYYTYIHTYTDTTGQSGHRVSRRRSTG